MKLLSCLSLFAAGSALAAEPSSECPGAVNYDPSTYTGQYTEEACDQACEEKYQSDSDFCSGFKDAQSRGQPLQYIAVKFHQIQQLICEVPKTGHTDIQQLEYAFNLCERLRAANEKYNHDRGMVYRHYLKSVEKDDRLFACEEAKPEFGSSEGANYTTTLSS
ncbi:hypothetical protein HIM_07219 [Hirsutella minnesotensis 3608]|uniref:Uncharacterized protein n=1 Tax=Hirsutella minnesotensis 3608 TaxID=1043627 RepID=A0A0F7ZNA8_9HYPO|nr:hypothetical protein HIM_07219 [Hirsutella minnesotensis 3608]